MINDIFIMDTSGLPHLARCYGGTACKLDQNHTLLTGFFAAISSFKGEFNQTELQLVGFDMMKLVFYTEGETMAVIATDLEDDVNNTREIAKAVIGEFHLDTGIKDKGSIIGVYPSETYIDWLDSYIGMKAMMDIEPLVTAREKSFWSKLKSYVI